MSKSPKLDASLDPVIIGRRMEASFNAYNKDNLPLESAVYKLYGRSLGAKQLKNYFKGQNLTLATIRAFCEKIDTPIDIIINPAASSHAESFDYVEQVDFHFSGYDIAMLVRFFNTLKEKAVIDSAYIKIEGFYNKCGQKALVEGKITNLFSNGYIQTLTITTAEGKSLSAGGYSAMIEDVRSENIVITLPKNAIMPLRDTIFILYTNPIIDNHIDNLPICHNFIRHLIVLLKKNPDEILAFSYLLQHASDMEMMSLGDYSALADAFHYFGHIQFSSKPTVIKAFNILKTFFYKCLDNNNLTDAEYCFNAAANLTKHNSINLITLFLKFSDDIITAQKHTTSKGSSKKNNISLLIAGTLNHSNIIETLNNTTNEVKNYASNVQCCVLSCLSEDEKIFVT